LWAAWCGSNLPLQPMNLLYWMRMVLWITPVVLQVVILSVMIRRNCERLRAFLCQRLVITG